MAYQVEVLPQTGIIVGGRTIRLGDTRADVERMLGEPGSVIENSLYYFQSELHIVLDKTNRVEFIDVQGGPDGTLQAVLDGVEVFQADPDAVYELLKGKNAGGAEENENGYSYRFLDLSVGLFRESIPKNVDEMIEEARADGHPLSIEDIEYEKRRTHWAAIGVGVKDYYR